MCTLYKQRIQWIQMADMFLTGMCMPLTQKQTFSPWGMQCIEFSQCLQSTCLDHMGEALTCRHQDRNYLLYRRLLHLFHQDSMTQHYRRLGLTGMGSNIL
jgi:hypothetical protein